MIDGIYLYINVYLNMDEYNKTHNLFLLHDSRDVIKELGKKTLIKLYDYCH